MSTKSRAGFIVCNEKCTPPDDYLKEACKHSPSWNGVAYVENGDLIWSTTNEAATVGGLKFVRNDESRKDLSMVFVLGREEDIDKTVAEDDDNMQPWEVIIRGEGDDAKTMVLLFVDGPLDQFANNPAPEGRPLLLVGTKLQTLIRDQWDGAGKDPVKFTEIMKRPYIEDAILAMLGEGGSAIVMTPVDKGIMYYGSPKDGEEYPWGFVNNSFGYTESSNLNKKKEELKGSTAASGVVEVVHFMRPAANIMKTSDMKELYTKYCGRAPNNNQMQKRQLVPILPNMVTEAKSDSKVTVSIIAGTTPATVVRPNAEATKATVADVNVKAEMKKFVDANVLVAMSPEEMEKNEAPKTTFWEKTGWKLDDYIIAKNSADIDKKLIKEYPDAAADLLRELRYAHFQLNKELEKATSPAGDKEPAAAPPAPARKGRFATQG